MADDAETVVDLQWAASAEFAQCAAYANVLALAFRHTSDMSPAEVGDLRNLWGNE